jgi:hypothetical protein
VNNKKPLRNSSLRIIDYKGSYYATFDGSQLWKMDRISYGLWKMCDGEKTYDEIIAEVAKKSNLSVKDVDKAVAPIFKEMEKMRFIKWK